MLANQHVRQLRSACDVPGNFWENRIRQADV